MKRQGKRGRSVRPWSGDPVYVVWPAEGLALMFFCTDGRQCVCGDFNDGDVPAWQRTDQAQAALGTAFTWGRDPTQPVPVGWRRVPLKTLSSGCVVPDFDAPGLQ